ncbi:hypothetical protein BDZ91DRAFT_713664, partial [Kalaharituber pfeilii]
MSLREGRMLHSPCFICFLSSHLVWIVRYFLPVLIFLRYGSCTFALTHCPGLVNAAAAGRSTPLQA